MQRIICLAPFVSVMSAVAYGQSTEDAVAVALLAAPPAMQGEAMAIRLDADGDHEVLRDGTNGLVCWDRSDEPQRSFSVQCTSVCAGKARSRGTRCRDVIFETLFETLWVSNPIRPRSATSRNRVMRGPGVTPGAKRSQGVRRPRDGAPKCIGREGRRLALDGRLHRRL